MNYFSARESNLLGGEGQRQSRNNSITRCPIDLFNSSNYSQELTLQTHAGKLKMDQKQMCYWLSNSKSRLHHGWIDCLRNHLCYEYEPCSGVQTIELLDIPFFFITGN